MFSRQLMKLHDIEITHYFKNNLIIKLKIKLNWNFCGIQQRKKLIMFLGKSQTHSFTNSTHDTIFQHIVHRGK